MKQNNIFKVDPRWLIATLSFVASISVAYSANITNTDGVLYLRAAEAFINGGFSAAQQLFDNPFYSILIGALSEVTTLSPFRAAQLLNAISCAAIGWLITDLGLLIGGSRIAALCSGVLFLLHPQFNGYRDFIIRDFGFWACLLGFLNLQLRYFLTLRKKLLISATLFLVIGALFRVESLLLLALPLLSLYPLRRHHTIIRQTLQLYGVVLVAGLIITSVIATGWLIDPSTLLKPAERFINMSGSFYTVIESHEMAFQEHLLNGFLEEYALAGVIAAFVVIVVGKALKSFTLPYIIISGILAHSMASLRLSTVRTAGIYSFFAYYCAIIVVFTITSTVIQGRHVLPLTLVLLPLLGCYLEHWLTLTQKTKKQRKQQFSVVAIFTLYLFVDSFFSFGTPKTHIPDSINWLKQHASECTLTTNHSKVAYFSGLDVDWKQVLRLGHKLNFKRLERSKSELIAFEYHKRAPELMNLREQLSTHFTPVAEFDSKKRGVLIVAKDPDTNCLNLVEQK